VCGGVILFALLICVGIAQVLVLHFCNVGLNIMLAVTDRQQLIRKSHESARMFQ